MADELSGRCGCGAVRFTVSGAPLWVAHCHCRDCRAVTGSAFTTFAGYPTEEMRWQGDAPAVYRSSPGVIRRFCGKCGTPLSFEGERWPGELHIYVCTLADPAALAPRVHVHVREQLPWVHLADRLPRYRGTGGEGPPIEE